jgi:mRNA interferase MazF
VLSSDRFVGHSRVTVLPLTSDPLDAPPLRIDLAPTAANGLNELSQVMLDRIAGIEVRHVRRVIGHLADADMQAIERGVLVYLGFA